MGLPSFSATRREASMVFIKFSSFRRLWLSIKQEVSVQ